MQRDTPYRDTPRAFLSFSLIPNSSNAFQIIALFPKINVLNSKNMNALLVFKGYFKNYLNMF